MSCRSNHGNSAMTSYARASSGLGDVQTLHLFHRLVGEGRAGDVQAPSGQTLEEWRGSVTEQVENDQSISDGQRQRILNRLGNLNGYTPDGPTFYAWQYIGQRAREGQGALDQTYGLLGTALGLTPEQREARVQELEQQFDRGEVPRNWQPPAELMAGVGEWQGYRMGSAPFYGTRSLPQDRRTLYVLATLASNAGVVGNQPPRPAETTEEASSPTQTTPTPSTNRCPNCGQFGGEGSHNCPAEIEFLNGYPNLRTFGTMLTTPLGLEGLRNVAQGAPDLISSNRDGQNINFSAIARQLLAWRAEQEAANVPAQDAPVAAPMQPTCCPNCGQFAGEEGHNCPAEVVVLEDSHQGQTLMGLIETEESGPLVNAIQETTLDPTPAWLQNLPPPDMAGVWNELYLEMPQDDPYDLNAPESAYEFEAVTNPLLSRSGEVANFNRLHEKWATEGFHRFTPSEADQLYDYQRRRLRFQAGRLNVNYALAVRGGRPDRVDPVYQQLAEGLKEYQKRRLQLNQMQRERQAAGYPVGFDPDENEEGVSADFALSTWLSVRADFPHATGQGLVWDRPTAEPQFDLPNYSPPNPQEAEPLYLRVRAGQGEGLRRSIAQSGLPIIVAEATTPVPAGAVILNWGDYEWAGSEEHAVINSGEAVEVARDKLLSLERLGELAPASTTRPTMAVARFGPVFAGKGRTGQSGSGKAILQNLPGGPVDRPLGNLTATEASGYDYYQEYLPNRKEYRALVLGGEVIALYHRVPQGTEPGQLRPDNFEYQPLTTIGQRQLQASQLAMERVGLDFGGVDLVEDEATGRLLVLEVNSAPGLGQESLERLYNAVQAQLHRPEE